MRVGGILFIVLGVFLLAAGIVYGIWGTELSGTFYLVEKLPEPFRTFSKFNPIFYLIDGFRYGFIGRAEGSVLVGATMTGGLVLALGFVCFRMFQTGYKIKT